MVGRRRPALQAALGTPGGCSVAHWVLAALSLRAALPFLLPGSPQTAARGALELHGAAAAGAAPRPLPHHRAEGGAAAGGLLAVAAAAVGGAAAAALRGVRRSGARNAAPPARRGQRVARRAEDEDFDSILGRFQEEDANEEAEKEKIESEMVEEFVDLGVTGDGLEDDDAGDETMTDAELARAGKTRVVYKGLVPSKAYCRMIAIENAKRTWQNDWKGPGCSIPVKIAKLTEVIRALTIHCRENYHDYLCRRRLIMRVADRRRLLDTLSWTNVEGYLKIREALKIRHTYRPEALINRLRSLRYPYRNRMPAPGKKTLSRLKKRERLFTRRMSNLLKQGASGDKLRRARSKMKNQRWAALHYDDARSFLAGKQALDFVNPMENP